MATITPVGTWIKKKVHKATWSSVNTSGDTHYPYSAPDLPDKTIFVTGTFNSATITIQGSNYLATATTGWVTLSDPNGNALTFTADSTEAILENPLFIRPHCSGATGGTDVDVIIVAHGE